MFTLVFLFVLRAGASYETLPRGTLDTALGRDYRVIRDLTLELARAYPAAGHLFVNVSQVPTPVIAMLRAIYGDDAVRNLPLGYLKHLQPPGIRVFGKFESTAPTSEDEYLRLRRELYTPATIRHFRDELMHALPTAAELGQRRVVYLEWANQGLTITNLGRELRAFLNEAPAECYHPYTLIALTHGRGFIRSVLQHQGVRTRVVRGRALEIFDRRLYRDFAEFGAYRPWPGEERPRPRPQFIQLVEAYRRAVARDPVVRHARGESLSAPARVRAWCAQVLARGTRAIGR